jgi:hypothetical protein
MRRRKFNAAQYAPREGRGERQREVCLSEWRQLSERTFCRQQVKCGGP